MSRKQLRFLPLLALATAPLLAQGIGGDPWTQMSTNLSGVFTGPIAKGLSLVALVIGGGGLMYEHSGAHGRVFYNILFGGAMAIGAGGIVASFL